MAVDEAGNTSIEEEVPLSAGRQTNVTILGSSVAVVVMLLLALHGYNTSSARGLPASQAADATVKDVVSLSVGSMPKQDIVDSQEFGKKICDRPSVCTSDCGQAKRDNENEKWPYCKADNKKGWEYCYCCKPDEKCEEKFTTHDKEFNLCTPKNYFPNHDEWVMPVCATKDAEPDVWNSDLWLNCQCA
mmetsp:Transcript_38124/g.75607  ORF Transcript_38124/g.75607 Transcript_38124/m.75607 type:complete len:188 (-) Transcript_38124:162-725(-)